MFRGLGLGRIAWDLGSGFSGAPCSVSACGLKGLCGVFGLGFRVWDVVGIRHVVLLFPVGTCDV